MKVVRWHGLLGHVQRLEMRGSHGIDVVDVLHLAVDHDIRIVEDGLALAIEDIGHHHGIRDAGFIFDAQEQQSFGGAGALAAYDAAGCTNLVAVAHEFQLRRGRDAERVHLLAMKRHGVLADGEVATAKVRIQTLTGIHGRERRGVGYWLAIGKEGT